LLLVRHSAPILDRALPAEDWVLSDEGRARCVPLAQRLASYAPRTLIASPEPKARETAELIAPVLGLRVVIDARLRETARRTVGWLAREQLEAGIRELFARPSDVVFGEESAAAALARFEAAVRDLPEPAVVVTHGTILSLYAAARTDGDAFALWQSLDTPGLVLV
jgi:broad specificity phosphatase PhoE